MQLIKPKIFQALPFNHLSHEAFTIYLHSPTQSIHDAEIKFELDPMTEVNVELNAGKVLRQPETSSWTPTFGNPLCYDRAKTLKYHRTYSLTLCRQECLTDIIKVKQCQ